MISLQNVATAVFSTPPVATVGLTEEQAAEHGPVDVYVSKFTPMRHTLSGRARQSMLKLVVDQATQKVVGAHMLGEDAPEIMQGLAIAIVMGATKADFDRTIGIHPTAAEEFVTCGRGRVWRGWRRRRSSSGPHATVQSSVFSRGTRANSRRLAVTSVAPRRRACAAIRIS